jgi:hypothetical protein
MMYDTVLDGIIVLKLHLFMILLLLFQTSTFEALAPSFQVAFSLMKYSLGGTGEVAKLL